MNLIPIYISITHDITDNYVHIWCDAGRLLRPLLHFVNGKPSYEHNQDKITSEENSLAGGYGDLCKRCCEEIKGFI